ncbi:MAG: hypothetical protein WCO00_12185 [Rhodospirillaceae bacterium]
MSSSELLGLDHILDWIGRQDLHLVSGQVFRIAIADKSKKAFTKQCDARIAAYQQANPSLQPGWDTICAAMAMTILEARQFSFAAGSRDLGEDAANLLAYQLVLQFARWKSVEEKFARGTMACPVSTDGSACAQGEACGVSFVEGMAKAGTYDQGVSATRHLQIAQTGFLAGTKGMNDAPAMGVTTRRVRQLVACSTKPPCERFGRLS